MCRLRRLFQIICVSKYNNSQRLTLNSQLRKELSQLDFLKNIANLLKVKTIVTLAVMAVFSTLAMKGTITADNVMIVVSTVIAFYFGTQHEK